MINELYLYLPCCNDDRIMNETAALIDAGVGKPLITSILAKRYAAEAKQQEISGKLIEMLPNFDDNKKGHKK